MQGYMGNVTYSGSLGTVNTSRQVYVSTTEGTSEYSIQHFSGSRSTNSGAYYINCGGFLCSPQPGPGSYYLLAWYDLSGVGGTFGTAGDPWTVVGPFSTSVNPSSIPITITDAYLWVGGTNTPSPTFSNTQTPTQTPTLTPVFSYTNTLTATVTSTPTQTSTATSDPYQITGSVAYTGGKSTAGFNVMVGAAVSIGGNTAAMTLVTPSSSGVSYTLNMPSSGTYVLYAFLTTATSFNNGGPNVGDSYTIYNGQTLIGTPTSISLSGVTLINLSFNDTNFIPGVSGSVNFTGSNPVNGNNQLFVQGYSDSGYTSPLAGGGGHGVTVNGGTYKVLNLTGVSPIYLQAYYSANGSGSLSACDPVTNLSSLSGGNSAVTNQGVTISGTNLYNCGTYSLSGTVNYGPGGVSSTDPILVRAVTCQGTSGPCGMAASDYVTSNGGGYSLNLPTGGAYYVTEEYVGNPSMFNLSAGMGWSGQISYAIGSEVANSDGTCCGSGPNGLGTPITINGNAVTNLSFSNTCGQMQGYTGTVNYTGSMGSISDNNRVWVATTDGVTENSFQHESGGWQTNDATYYLNVGGYVCSPQPGPGSYYLMAWYDKNGAGCCNGTAGDPWTVVGPFSSSVSPSSIPISFDDSNIWFVGTSTPSYTATPDPTDTPTVDPTYTPTPDPTDTPTITLTPVFSYTNTETSTITLSPTNTCTPTITISATSTVTPTISPTPSPTGVYLTGSVNYSGSVGTVSGTNPIGVEVYTNSSLIKGNGGVSIAAAATITSNGGGFNLLLPGTGTYYVLVQYDSYGNGVNNVDQGGPLPGEPYAIAYGMGNTTYEIPAPAVNVGSGSTNLGTINLNDQNVAEGITGPVSYTGGGVSSSNSIHLLAYQSGTSYGTLVTDNTVKSNGATFYLTLLNGNNNSENFDLAVFYDSVGNASIQSTPTSGEPVTYINNLPTTVAAGNPVSYPVTFSNTVSGYSSPLTVGVSESSYALSGTNQLGVLVANNFGGGGYMSAEVQNSNQPFVFNDAPSGNVYVGVFYGISGIGYTPGYIASGSNNKGGFNPNVGDIYQFYGFNGTTSGSTNNTEACFANLSSLGGGPNVAIPAGGVSLNAIFPYSTSTPCTFTGVAGTFSVTDGTIDSNHQVYIELFPATSNVLDTSHGANNNQFSSAGTYNELDIPLLSYGEPQEGLVAWWDKNAEGALQCGSGNQYNCPRSDDSSVTYFFPIGTVNNQTLNLN